VIFLDSLISIHNVWIEKIFNREKFLEFRHSIGKNIEVGDTVYMYETYFNKGRKKVVGEFAISSIDRIDRTKSRIGCYHFLKTYVTNILEDKEILDILERAYKINLKDYYNDLVLDCMFFPEALSYMEKHEEPMPTELIDYSSVEYSESRKKANKLMKDCDDWLRSIGYYNEYDESFYDYAIGIANPIQYSKPIDITQFELTSGKKLTRAPQSWCYVKRRED
jgi:predicted transcriptional regulator